MDLSGLEALKRMLVESNEFAAVWNKFMADFGDRREFMELGEPARSPLVESAVRQSVVHVLGPEAEVTGVLLLRLPEHHFWHGAVLLPGRMGNVLYFDDLGVGLLVLVMSMAGDNRIIRFTARTPEGELQRQ